MRIRHYFLINFSQTPGQLKKYINNIIGPNDDITRFEYLKKNNKVYETVFLGIELQNENDIYNIIKNMDKYNFTYHKLEPDDQLYSYLI